MNLKQVRFKKNVEHDVNTEKITLSIKGRNEFTAGMIGTASQNFEVMNGDLVICTMDPTSKLDIELTISKGRGYIPSEDNKVKDAP
ncbi:DNA-directed RNA polymerase subunit alpha, partial [Acinetobacter baumannii]